jgi:hypothetical protein
MRRDDSERLGTARIGMHVNDRAGSWHAWYADLEAFRFFGPFYFTLFVGSLPKHNRFIV